MEFSESANDGSRPLEVNHDRQQCAVRQINRPMAAIAFDFHKRESRPPRSDSEHDRAKSVAGVYAGRPMTNVELSAA